MSIVRQIKPASDPPREPVSTPSWPSPDAVRAQLTRLLNSPSFKSSRRCAGFLQYVTEQAAQGRTEQLKERAIGVEFFGRAPGYDTNDDSVVRATAGEVRKRLAQYYLDPAHQSELRFDLPLGSYIPQILPAAEDHPAAPVEPSESRAPFRSPWLTWPRFGLAALLLAIALSAAFWLLTRPASTALDSFWTPILDSPGSVLICVGQPVAYQFSGWISGGVGDKFDSPDFLSRHGDDRVPLKDILRFKDRFVTIYDAEALSRTAALLAVKAKPYRIRGGGSISFADLRENAAVLIGAFDNQWTLWLAGAAQRRFSFASDPAEGVEMIRDRQNPAHRKWSLVRAWPEWKVSEDYALVSRLRDPTTGRVVVTAAGITHFGTHAASEFLTNPAAFQEVLSQAPGGWERKNIEIVLGVSVVHGVPGPPRVLAAHFW